MQTQIGTEHYNIVSQKPLKCLRVFTTNIINSYIDKRCLRAFYCIAHIPFVHLIIEKLNNNVKYNYAMIWNRNSGFSKNCGRVLSFFKLSKPRNSNKLIKA